MIRMTGTIILQSGLNSDMEIVIVPFFSDLDNILDLNFWAYIYYQRWLGGGDEILEDTVRRQISMPIGDYIQEKLKKHGYVHNQNYEMFFSANWDKEE